MRGVPGGGRRREGENTDKTERDAALGTPEAAVQSCVKLMSMLFEQPEKYVAFYLDLYYQVRLAYERGREPPPLRREDMIPAMREIWEELLAESEKRSFACAQDDKGGYGGPGLPCAPKAWPLGPIMYTAGAETGVDASGQDGTKVDASGQDGTGVDASGQDGPPPARRKGSGKKAAATPQSPPAAATALLAGEPKPEQAESKLGPWMLYKRKQLARLRAAREAGLTLAQIEKEDPVLTVRTVTNMLGGQYATRDSWNALEKAMDRWDKRRAAALDQIEAGKGQT